MSQKTNRQKTENVQLPRNALLEHLMVPHILEQTAKRRRRKEKKKELKYDIFGFIDKESHTMVLEQFGVILILL